jgi:sporulation protein YlmC with PRC-barrel domain
MIYLVTGLFLVSLFFVAETSYSGGAYHKSHAMRWNTTEVSTLIGYQVWDSQGSILGQIAGFAIDPASGRIISVGLSDVPGMHAQKVCIPYASLTRAGEHIFVYKPPEDTDAYYFYGEAPYWTEGLYTFSKQGAKDVFRTSRLIGAPVHTSEGEGFAWINDLVIDPGTGHVVYVVLYDLKGMEEKMVAVPFSTLSRDRENYFAVNIDRDKLFAAPEFRWEHSSDRRYAGDLYRYYGLQPYWEAE